MITMKQLEEHEDKGVSKIFLSSTGLPFRGDLIDGCSGPLFLCLHVAS
jgi:hypothetical protein